MAALTSLEHETLELTAKVANNLRAIIGDGPQAAHDWNEAAAKIHDLQHLILAQAAARAYPTTYRLLGQQFGE